MIRLNITLVGLLLAVVTNAQKQVIWWNDTTSQLVNHRVFDIIQLGDRLMCLSAATDVNYSDPHIGVTTLTTKGDQLNYKIASEISKVHQVNRLIPEPSKNIRVYVTRNEGRLSPFVYVVNGSGTYVAQTAILVNVPHFLGDILNAGTTDYIWTKSLLGSQTNLWNCFVYRVNMAENENQIWRCKLESTYNEEAKRLVLLPDQSVLLLAKRFSEGSMNSFYPVVYRIDNAGNKVWEKELQDYPDAVDIDLASDHNAIYFTCSYGSESDPRSESKLVKMDMEGTIQNAISLDNINAKGLLILQSGNLLVYGGFYSPNGMSFIKKAKVMTLKPDLKMMTSSYLGPFDNPDAQLPGLAISMYPTASDILCAIQLTDKRVVLGGRVFMQKDVRPDKILLSQRANRNMLIITSESGAWKSDY